MHSGQFLFTESWISLGSVLIILIWMVWGLAWEHFTKGPCFPDSDPWKHDVLGTQTPNRGAARKMQSTPVCIGRALGNHPAPIPTMSRSVPERLEQNQVHVWSWASMVGESYSFELVHRGVLRPKEAIAGCKAFPLTPRAACCSLPLADGRNSERNSMTEHFSQQWSLHQLLVSVIPRGFWESLVSLHQWPSNLFGCDCTKECIVLSRRVLPDMTVWNKNTQASYGWEMQIIPVLFPFILLLLLFWCGLMEED